MSSSPSKILIGINGFGRIGRLSLRASLTPSTNLSSSLSIIHINDPFTSIPSMCSLLNYDSAQGRFHYTATPSSSQDLILIKDSFTSELISEIRVTSNKPPSEIPWGLSSVSVVLDCTGLFLTLPLASAHISLTNRVRRVVISAPSKDDQIPLLVLGVNDSSYYPYPENKNDKDIPKVVSNSSCTTNCLAPIIKAVSKKYRIAAGLMTTIHAVTANQSLVDGNNPRSIRTGFSGMGNIVPASTGAAKAVGKVIPEVEGVLTGMAMRVPTLTGSVVDLVLRMEDDRVGLDAVIGALREFEKECGGKYLRVNDEGDLTSAGVVGEMCSSVVDTKACMEVAGKGSEKLVKIVSWYDNEWGYSCRLVELGLMVGKSINDGEYK